MSVESLSDIDDEDLDADEDIRRLVDYVLEREANEAVERPETEKTSDTSWLSRLHLGNEGETETEFDATRTGSRPETTRSRDRYIGFEPFEKYESEYWKTPDDHDGPISARVFSRDAEGDLRLGRFIEGDQALYGFKGNYTDTRRMLQVRGEAGTGDDSVMPIKAGAEVNVMESEAKAGVETTVNLEEGQATAAAKLGANLTVVEIKGEAEGTFIPARKIDALCDRYPWLGSNRFTQSLCALVANDEYDFGVRLEGEAGASVGVGASAQGEASYRDRRFRVRGNVRAQALVGARGGGGAEIGLSPMKINTYLILLSLVLLNPKISLADELMMPNKGDFIQLETLSLNKVPLCDGRDIPIYAIIKSKENHFGMPDSCGRFYVQLQSDGVERALTAGSLFYPERIEPTSYDRYKIWLASALTTDGGEPDGTTAFRARSVDHSTLNRSEIVTKYLGSEDKRSWLLYDIGISDYIDGTIVQFYSVPYIITEGLADEFFEGEEFLDAQLLLKDARRWFRENADLLAREADSLRR